MLRFSPLFGKAKKQYKLKNVVKHVARIKEEMREARKRLILYRSGGAQAAEVAALADSLERILVLCAGMDPDRGATVSDIEIE